GEIGKGDVAFGGHVVDGKGEAGGQRGEEYLAGLRPGVAAAGPFLFVDLDLELSAADEAAVAALPARLHRQGLPPCFRAFGDTPFPGHLSARDRGRPGGRPGWPPAARPRPAPPGLPPPPPS